MLTDEKNPRAAGPKKKVIHYKQEENSLNRHLAPLASSQNTHKAYIFLRFKNIKCLYKQVATCHYGGHTYETQNKEGTWKSWCWFSKQKTLSSRVCALSCLFEVLLNATHFLNYSSHLESNKTLACKRPAPPDSSVKSVLRSSDRVSKHPNGDSKITQLDTSNRTSLTSG